MEDNGFQERSYIIWIGKLSFFTQNVLRILLLFSEVVHLWPLIFALADVKRCGAGPGQKNFGSVGMPGDMSENLPVSLNSGLIYIYMRMLVTHIYQWLFICVCTSQNKKEREINKKDVNGWMDVCGRVPGQSFLDYNDGAIGCYSTYYAASITCLKVT